MRRQRWWGAIACVPVLLTACSGDGSATSTTTSPGAVTASAPVSAIPVGPTPDACSLASTAEVTKVTGLDELTPTASEALDFRRCDFTDPSGNPVATVRVSTVDADPAPPSEFAVLAQQPDAEEVPGLGEAALWSNGALNVLVGDEYVSITVDSLQANGDLAAFKAASLALARIVAPRFAAQEAAAG